MAYTKIESSGCCIHKGWIQVRLCFYLEPADPRYNEHHVYVIDETSQAWKKGYKGAKDSMGSPVNQADYDAWIAGLPHIWRDNPFHNHFIFVDAVTPNTEILKQAQDSFNEFFAGWSEGKDMLDIWRSKVRPTLMSKTLSPAELTSTNNRLSQIKAMVI